MRDKVMRIIIGVLVVFVLSGALFYTLTNLDFFTIRAIEINTSGPVTNTTSQVYRILTPLKGKNIFSVQLGKIRNDILQTEAVRDTRIRRYFPDRLIVDIYYKDYLARVTVDDRFYFAGSNGLLEVSKDVWEAYSLVRPVELDDQYARFLAKWGYDEGFFKALELVSGIECSLISNILYDNNNGNDFGRLIIDLKALGVKLYICENVTPQRADEAIEIIRSEISVPEGSVRYDLYSGTLVRRN